MIGRYKPAQRFAPLRPRTLKEHMAAQERSSERKRKRLAKRRALSMGPTRTTLRAQLDHLWSLIVRRRDRTVHAGLCLICVIKHQLGIQRYEKQPIEVGYHIEPRGDDMVRWRLDNGCGACKRCNDGEKWSRSGGRAVVKETYRKIHVVLLGETKVQELEALAKQTADFSTADLIEKRDQMKAILEGHQS